MTEAKQCYLSSSGSDDSLVLVEESTDGMMGERHSEFTESNRDEPTLLEQQGTPIYVTDVHVVENSSVTKDDISSSEEHTTLHESATMSQKIGAGVTVGIVTAPFLGPLALVAGIAAAHGTTKNGAVGDICRAAGDIAIIAREKAMEVEKKHNLTNKTTENARQIVNKAKDVNQKHQILETLKKMMICTLKNVANVLQFAAEKMKESSASRNTAGCSYAKVYSDEVVTEMK